MDNQVLLRTLVMAQGFCEQNNCGLTKEAISRAAGMVAEELQKTSKPQTVQEAIGTINQTFPYSIMTLDQMAKALHDHKIPTEKDCDLLAKNLDILSALRKYVFALEDARQHMPRDI